MLMEFNTSHPVLILALAVPVTYIVAVAPGRAPKPKQKMPPVPSYDLLGNIIAGIALEIGKPFKTGDWLVFDNRHMEVIEVNWRSTRLRTNDDAHLDVPNKTIAGSTITNLTMLTRHHAIRIQVGFDY